MERFEAYLVPGGDIEVFLVDRGRTFRLDSAEGMEFSAELIGELERYYPTMLVAAGQKIRRENRSLYSMISCNRRLYLSHVAHTVCSCCFGERDDIPDYDGESFRMERPDKCRDARYCPWNGYAERNAGSLMVICGGRREYGFTPVERRIALLVRRGYVSPPVIAGAMALTQKSVWNHLTNIYRKTGTAGMPELITRLYHENI